MPASKQEYPPPSTRAGDARKPLVAVVITAYNSTELLDETLRSACGQTWPEKEIIVVDDGSPPESAALIARVVEKFPGVILAREPNRGPSGARNRGVALTRGEYVAFLDHDDVWRDGLIDRLMAKIESDPKLGLVFCRIEHMRESGEPTGRISSTKLTGFTVSDMLISDPACCGSSFIARRSAYEATGGFGEAYRRGEAPEFFIRLILAGWKIEGIDDALVLYRNTADGLSAKGGKMLEDRMRILRDTLPKCPELGSGRALAMRLRWTEFKNRMRKVLIG